MTKILIVYYSLTGSTRFIAETLQDVIQADILELKPIKDLNPDSGTKFMWGGYQAKMKKKPGLEEFKINPLGYDLLIIGTPVWAWTITPPIRSFLSMFELTDKKVALWTCSAGSGEKAMERFKKAMKGTNIVGNIRFQFEFKNPLDKELTDYKIRVKAWASELREKI